MAAYLIKYDYNELSVEDIRVEQGTEIGRPSLLYLRASRAGDSITVQVGSKVFPIARGTFF